jgi:hypothetical protein
MYFDPTPLNVTTLLVIALAIIALMYLMKGRLDSNLPSLFYMTVILLTNTTDRTVNPYLLYSGLVLSLFVRFEFMGKGFTKFVTFLTGTAIVLLILNFLDDMMGGGTMFL